MMGCVSEVPVLQVVAIMRPDDKAIVGDGKRTIVTIDKPGYGVKPLGSANR